MKLGILLLPTITAGLSLPWDGVSPAKGTSAASARLDLRKKLLIPLVMNLITLHKPPWVALALKAST